MTDKDDVQATEQPNEEGTELELGGKETPVETPEAPRDPLDEITDTDELRNKAKGYRSASTRYKKERDEAKDKPPEEPKEEPKGEFLTKEDFYKANERKAINSLTVIDKADSDEVKAQKTYVKDNWKDISAFYQPRLGKDTPEDILADLNDALTLYTSKNPRTEDVDTGKVMQETSGTGHQSPTPTEEKKEPPNFVLPVQPVDKDGNVNWYPDNREKKSK